MFVLVQHNITDPMEWEYTAKRISEMVQQGKLPKGVKGWMCLPSTDGHHADSLWETPTLLVLRVFVDRETGMAAISEYFEIKEDAAFGLPGREMAQQAA